LSFCPKCGKEIRPSDYFCGNCGEMLDRRPVAKLAKRLYRSRRDRVLGGVCGGIGEYFNIDPTLVRIGWALFSLVYGACVILYIILWLIVPVEPLEGR